MNIFGRDNPYLEDLLDDVHFSRALEKARSDINKQMEAAKQINVRVPKDEINLLQLKIKFTEMVWWCMIPSPSLWRNKWWGRCHLVNANQLISKACLVTDEYQELLFHIALRIFLWGKYWSPYDIWEIKAFLLLQNKLYVREEHWCEMAKNWARTQLPDSIGTQKFDWNKCKQLLKQTRFYIENEQQDHSASRFVIEDFLERTLKNIQTIHDYAESEYMLLLAILEGHWKYRAIFLRRCFFFVQKLRRAVNDHLAHKIPDQVNQDLFEKLREKQWWVTADKSKYV